MSEEQKRCTTDGLPPIDPTAVGAPGPIDPATGQHTQYWVLCEEERAKGFIRPVRHSYVHKGIRPKYPTRPTTEEEKERHGERYIVWEEYPPEMRPLVGRAWTKEQLESGCGTVTTMGQALAETYARDPKFYGATFCCQCRKHLPVEEFVWEDGSVVGS